MSSRSSKMRHYAVFGIVAFMVLGPLVFLILGSFSTARMPTDFRLADMGLKNYAAVYLDRTTYDLLVNTIIYVAGSVLLGVSLAVFLAWLVERTDMPGKLLVYAGVPMTLAVPGMLQAMAWVLLLSPRIGFFNQILRNVFDLPKGPLNIYSLPGMIFLEGLRLAPTAFLMLVPLFRSMDPSLEEAASASGARPTSTFFKVTARLLAPGLFAVMVYQAMTALEVFEIPGVLGLPAGIYVFSTKIYSIVQAANIIPVYGQANALAMVYLLIAVVTSFLYSRMIRRAYRFSIITGKGYRPRLFHLGRWKFPALGAVLLYLFLSVVAPFTVFVYTSFLPYLQPFSLEAITSFTLKNYRLVFASEELWQTLKNTTVMAVTAATMTTALAFAVSLVVVRSQFWGRRILDQMAFFPHAIPGIVMGVALMWIFLKLDFILPVYGTIWAIAIGFSVQFLAYGTRAMNASLLQIHKELEEAAYASGARPWRTVLRVLFPLMLTTFAGVWIYVVLLTVRIAGMPLMLYQGSENQVLAILMWNMWDAGYVGSLAAIGTLLILGLFMLTLGVRALGFGRHGAMWSKS